MDGNRKIIGKLLKDNIRQYSMFIALLIIGVFFTIQTEGNFIAPRNLSNLLFQTVHIAILAVGMVLVIVAGHIDLSVGSIAGFTGAVAAILQVQFKMGTLPAVLITLLCGLLIGVWQGYWIAYRGVPAFIATLGGMLIFRGAVIGVTQGKSIAPLNPSFEFLGEGYLPFLRGGKESLFSGLHDSTLLLGIICILIYIFLELRRREQRKKYGFHVLGWSMEILKLTLVSLLIFLFFIPLIRYRGIPIAALITAALVLLFSFLADNTVFGRHVYALGGNKEAAKLSGINIKSCTLWIFILMGLLSAVSGIVFTARLNAATAQSGNLFELDTIAAVIIGGTSTMGGEGTIIGAIIGALVMSSLNNGMGLMNIPIEYQYIVKGLILLLAVWFDISSRKRVV